MTLDVAFTPAELPTPGLAGSTAVVIDVLRATSTLVEALANGAKVVLPVASVEEASRLVRHLERREVLLCGERGGVRVEGFDLGNSPAEFTPAQVAGKRLIMTTTNGTVALRATVGHRGRVPRRTLVASFLNLSAVAAELERERSSIVLVCAGREGNFALEDAVLAGMLVDRVLASSSTPPELNDAALVARSLGAGHGDRLVEMFRETAAGRQLTEVGFTDDLAFCAKVDRHSVMASLQDGQVTLDSAASS